jgi:hypothetical protein
VFLHHRPNAGQIDPSVFMPQMVAKTSDIPPCHSRAQLLRSVAELDGGFADPSQTAFHGIDRLSSCSKEALSMPAVCRSMRPTFSRMSSNATRGSRERNDKILVCARLRPRPEAPLLDELDPTTEKVGKMILDMDDVE